MCAPILPADPQTIRRSARHRDPSGREWGIQLAFAEIIFAFRDDFA
jgi:hypothetical protein